MLQKTAFVNTILLVLMLSSCHSTRIVEREVIKHDSIYITAVSIDTLIQRDSIHTYEKGDTLVKTVYKYIYKVRERTDTAYIERTDTLWQNVEVEKVKKVTDLRLCLYSLIIGAVIGFLGFVIYRKSVS